MHAVHVTIYDVTFWLVVQYILRFAHTDVLTL